MFDQWVSFVITAAFAALIYVLLTLGLVEGWRYLNNDILMPWSAVLLNCVGLFLGALAAYVMQRRWVFKKLRSWWRYVLLMLVLALISELFFRVLLSVLGLSYPLTLMIVLTVAMLVAFALCRGGKIV